MEVEKVMQSYLTLYLYSNSQQKIIQGYIGKFFGRKLLKNWELRKRLKNITRGCPDGQSIDRCLGILDGLR